MFWSLKSGNSIVNDSVYCYESTSASANSVLVSFICGKVVTSFFLDMVELDSGDASTCLLYCFRWKSSDHSGGSTQHILNWSKCYSSTGFSAPVVVSTMFDMCVPHPRTIEKWLKVIDGRPGFTSEAFDAPWKHTKLHPKKQLTCALMMDQQHWLHVTKKLIRQSWLEKDKSKEVCKSDLSVVT